MLIVRTPFRVSFFGGGTDYSEYYSARGGQVISTTMDKYCYVSMRHLPPYFDFKNQATYSVIERFQSVDEVRHPLIRAALQYLPTDRIQLVYDADLPARSGIGSSSSFAVALLQGLHRMRGETADPMTLAQEAIHLERELCAEAGGVQDQLAAAFGGLNQIRMSAEKFEVHPIRFSKQKQLQDNLILAFTGFTRFSGDVAKEQKKNIVSCFPVLDEIKALSQEAYKLLVSDQIDAFGRLLHEEWMLKRTLSGQITTESIDRLYADLRSAGVYGGKLLGAGSGGFLLLYIPAEMQPYILEKFPDIRFVPFAFDQTGSTILYENDA